jgi:hypothetical protein
MSTSSSIIAPPAAPNSAETFRGNWRDPRAQAVVAGYDPLQQITVTRAAGNAGVEYVFIEEGDRLAPSQGPLGGLRRVG